MAISPHLKEMMADVRKRWLEDLICHAYLVGDEFADNYGAFVRVSDVETNLRAAKGALGYDDDPGASELIGRALQSLEEIRRHLNDVTKEMERLRDHAVDCAGGEERARARADAWTASILGEGEEKAA